MMYDYGNRLGNALILSTHLKKLNTELTKEMQDFSPGKSSLLKRMRKNRCNRSKTSGDAAGFMDFSKSKQLLCMRPLPQAFTDGIWTPFLTCI